MATETTPTIHLDEECEAAILKIFDGLATVLSAEVELRDHLEHHQHDSSYDATCGKIKALLSCPAVQGQLNLPALGRAEVVANQYFAWHKEHNTPSLAAEIDEHLAKFPL